MRPATAEIVGERLFDLSLARVPLSAKEGGCLHDHAVDAVAALHRLLVDEGLLDGMRLLGRAEAFQRRDLAGADAGNRKLTGAHRRAVDDHGAGAALPE